MFTVLSTFQRLLPENQTSAIPLNFDTMTDTYLPSATEQSIVVLGSFNPAIFHPYWFIANELVRDSDLKPDEKKLVVSQDATVFSSSWFELRALQRRVSLHATDPQMDLPLRDLVKGTFQCLEHTPVTAFGFNCSEVYALDSNESATAVIENLAPKSSWNSFLQSPDVEQVIVAGMNEGKVLKFRIEVHGNVVTINVNQHYDIPKEILERSAVETSVQFLNDRLTSDWESFLQYVRATAQKLVSIPAGAN